MQEKGAKEVYMRQVSQLIAEIDDLKKKPSNYRSSPYVLSGPKSGGFEGNNDSYFSPLQGNQANRAMALLCFFLSFFLFA